MNFFKIILVLTPLSLWRGAGGEVFSQNLVKNPSFENYIQCPIGFGLFNGYVQDWFGFSGLNNASYFNACAPLPDGVPKNSYGFQYANNGNGYTTILVYNWIWDPDVRMYIEGSFISGLKKDTIYCVKYFVNLCNTSLGAIKNIDAHISDTLLDWNNGYGYVLTGIVPQIKSQQLLNDSVGWLSVSGLYKAHGGEQHITLGNFVPNAQTTVLSFQPGNPIQVNYYIDDVSVTPANLEAPNLGKDTIICKNTLPYILNAPGGYDSYEWSDGSTGNALAVNDSGTYWLKCVLAGCGELSDTVYIGFNNTPILQLSNDTTLCAGSTFNLAAQPGFSSYQWSTTATTQTITVNDSGLYIVQATDVCGVQTDSIHVALDSIPNITIDIGIDTTLCQNGIDIPIVLSTAVLLPNYNWSNGATTSQITVTEKGWYWLKTNYRCGTLTSDTVFIDECPPDTVFGFYLPNSFTPNDDGRNDFFVPVYYNVTIQDCKIFNRWGEMVYQGKNDFSWDGSLNNRDCPMGIYIYKVAYTDANKKDADVIGRITLIR